VEGRAFRGDVVDDDVLLAADRDQLHEILRRALVHAAAAVPRLLDLGVPAYLLQSTLLGVMAQRLVRKLCPACRQPQVLSENSPEFRALGLDSGAQQTFFAPVGCDKCHGEGYRGRVGVFEVMSLNEEVRAAVVRKAPTSEIRALARRAGSHSLLKDALDKARAGLTTVSEAMRVAYQEG